MPEEYEISGIVPTSEVPDWERRPPKWSELVDKVLALNPGETLRIEFNDAKVGERARNAVRDGANLKAEAVVVRTRIVVNEETNSATLYLTRIKPQAGVRSSD